MLILEKPGRAQKYFTQASDSRDKFHVCQQSACSENRTRLSILYYICFHWLLLFSCTRVYRQAADIIGNNESPGPSRVGGHHSATATPSPPPICRETKYRTFLFKSFQAPERFMNITWAEPTPSTDIEKTQKFLSRTYQNKNKVSEAKKGIVVWFRIVDAMYLVILNFVVDKKSNFIYVDPLQRVAVKYWRISHLLSFNASLCVWFSLSFINYHYYYRSFYLVSIILWCEALCVMGLGGISVYPLTDTDTLR